MNEKFKRYVAVQYSGIYNMITEAHMAMALAELTKDEYISIQENYSKLKEEYPREHEEGKKHGETFRKVVYGE